MSYLEIKKLKKSFNNTAVLKDISLDIQQGEFICFLGPSGCGKTTLLRAICGLERQDNGSIIQNQQDISALPAEKRDFGIVFQSYALFPNLSVFDNIAFGLVNQKLKKTEIKKRVSHLLQLTNMQDQQKKFPVQLSGGQQQRVALARALAMQPGLLLLDEPLSALDAKIREHLRQQILQIHRQLGITSIMVTHDQAEAMSMADRIIVMNHGQIEQAGTPQEIYLQPKTAFVANFIGSCNTLNGQLIGDQLHLAGWSQAINLATPMQDKKNSEHPPILVRPEHLELHNVPPLMPHAAGKIGNIEFLGSQLLVEIHLHQPASQQPLKACLPLSRASQLQLSQNHDAYVTIAPEHCNLLPRSVAA